MRYASTLSVAALVGLIGGLGCSDITNVSNASSVTQTTQFDNPDGAILRRNGAYRDLLEAFGAQVEYSGLITDELTQTGGAGAVADRRVISSNDQQDQQSYPYPELSTARIEALRAISSLRTYNPMPRVRVGELFALNAYVELFFAEDMCSGVPLATLGSDGIPASGSGITRSEMRLRSLADFDSAAANAGDSNGTADPTVMSLIAIGRARALVDSGDFAAAVAALSPVPAGYSYVLQYLSTTAPGNILGRDFLISLDLSVSDREGIVGLPFVSGRDPRVVVDSNTQATFAGHPQYIAHSYSVDGQGVPINLASALEASLIRAEALLRAGQVQAWADTLNALRVAFGDTALSNHPLPSDSTTAASQSLRMQVMFRERAFWLFLTGHRQGDARRLIRQYGFTMDQVFPNGTYWSTPGVPYGNDVTFVPFLETRNTAYAGCVDRNP
jgi:hypothetical protein